MLHLQIRFPYIKTVNQNIQDLIFTSRGIYTTACMRQYTNCENAVLYTNRYSNSQNKYRYLCTQLYWYKIQVTCTHKVLIQEYTQTRSSQIWSPVFRRKLFLFLHFPTFYCRDEKPTKLVFDIRESYSKSIQENFALYATVFYPNTRKYGAKNPVFTVVLCSAAQLSSIKQIFML